MPVLVDNRRRLQLLAEHSNAGSGYELRLRRTPKLEAMVSKLTGKTGGRIGVGTTKVRNRRRVRPLHQPGPGFLLLYRCVLPTASGARTQRSMHRHEHRVRGYIMTLCVGKGLHSYGFFGGS